MASKIFNLWWEDLVIPSTRDLYIKLLQWCMPFKRFICASLRPMENMISSDKCVGCLEFMQTENNIISGFF